MTRVRALSDWGSASGGSKGYPSGRSFSARGATAPFTTPSRRPHWNRSGLRWISPSFSPAREAATDWLRLWRERSRLALKKEVNTATATAMTLRAVMSSTRVKPFAPRLLSSATLPTSFLPRFAPPPPVAGRRLMLTVFLKIVNQLAAARQSRQTRRHNPVTRPANPIAHPVTRPPLVGADPRVRPPSTPVHKSPLLSTRPPPGHILPPNDSSRAEPLTTARIYRGGPACGPRRSTARSSRA
jgi:hypothetical protein